MKKKLIIPNQPDLLGSKRKVSDFEPATPEEIHVNMVMPLEAALAQGVLPEAPTQIPIEAVCRMISTIYSLGNSLGQVQQVCENVLKMDGVPEEALVALRSLFAPPEPKDADDLIGSLLDPEGDK